MKEKIFAVILLFLLIGGVTLNTVLMLRCIDDCIDDVENTDLSGERAKDDVKKIYADFCSERRYISLTVNHDDLTRIEDAFVELIGYMSVSDKESAVVAKSRLIHCLKHLRRLSGFNIDSII